MSTYRFETTISSDRTLKISGLPFQPGRKVEVVVRDFAADEESGDRYPLRGKPIRYVDPFRPVAASDWDALK